MNPQHLGSVMLLANCVHAHKCYLFVPTLSNIHKTVQVVELH